MPRTICVVTGSRADFGLLYWPMRQIAVHPALRLQTVVTGSHLSPAFGSTWREVEAAGFPIDARVDMRVDGDSGVATSKSVGLGVIGFADVFEHSRPDIVMVLGDRYEILAAVTAALFARIPVAHIAGGDTTEGAFDEQLRHAVTKMSHLHFVTNGEAAQRVRQMGEDPGLVFDVGSPGLDRIRHLDYRPAPEVFAEVGLVPRRRNAVLAFHPATLSAEGAKEQQRRVFDALDRVSDMGIVATGSNADPEGGGLNAELERWAETRDNVVFRRSFPQELFLNLLHSADLIIGNSSCGLYEAPSFGLPAVNIGDRQAGRLRGRNVVDVNVDPDAIVGGIHWALNMDRRGIENPYGDGRAAERIVGALASIERPAELVRKRFFAPEVLHVVAA